jgi:hypothetical protein
LPPENLEGARGEERIQARADNQVNQPAVGKAAYQVSMRETVAGENAQYASWVSDVR